MGRPRKDDSEKARSRPEVRSERDTRPQGECSWCGLYRRLTDGFHSKECKRQAGVYAAFLEVHE